MKRKATMQALWFSAVVAFPTALAAQFHSLETQNLRLIYYDKTHEYIVSHLGRCFENAYRFHSKLFDYASQENVTVLLQDFHDFGHGGASPLPSNRISLGMAPFGYNYETQLSNERMTWLMNHELTHIVASDKAWGSDKFFRALFFGKVFITQKNPMSLLYSYLTTPRFYSPRWYHEGIAVFMETWMSGGFGRVLGAYDEMVFRTMVRDKSYFYDIVGLESEGTTIDFQVGVNSYLYGTRFMSYLANHHGPEQLVKWINRSEGSKKYFSSQFKHVYGTSLNSEWSKWIDWERDFQGANLDSIRLNPTTPYRPISGKALGSVSRAFYDADRRELYAAIRYPGQVAHLAAIDLDSGAIRKISDVKGAALFYVSSLAYDPATNTLFYTSDNNGWRDLNSVNASTGNSKVLIKDSRTGDLAFNPVDKALWGVRHYIGISTLVRIPYPYREWNQVYSFPYGEDIYDIDISPDGRTLTAALTKADGSQRLIKMETARLLRGETTFDVVFDFENSSPANFTFSPDGRYLYGSSYYSGVSNIYRYQVDEDNMDIISNCETGFFRPVPVSRDSLIVMRYTGNGFVPVMIPNQVPERVSAIKFLGNEIAQKYPIVRSWTLDSPAIINIDSLTVSSGRYNTLGSITLGSAYPVVEGFKDFAAAGMRFNFSDEIGLSGFDLTASYTPDTDLPRDERVHLDFNFHHWNWKFLAKYNAGDFYDLFGPTKKSRKGYALGLSYKKNLIFDGARSLDFEFDITGYGDLERLPDFQNVAATFDKLVSGNVSINYEYVRKSLGAVDDEKGVTWRLVTSSNYVNSDFFPRIHADLDYGFALPISHSSIWLRTSTGYSVGERENPFANFFFGGFGNNYVDHLTEKRYREYYSFPGVGLNAMGGKNYAKAMLEWNLPPIRFRRFGIPAFYFNWARLAGFSSLIRTNFDADESPSSLQQFGFRRTLTNIGGQIDFRIVLFSHLQSIISFGYAAALEKGDLSDEFMFSLKIL
ncbi:hypothetical protein MJD09_16660 [bacterium]|nr:hypothetical protein [bacterium]